MKSALYFLKNRIRHIILFQFLLIGIVGFSQDLTQTSRNELADGIVAYTYSLSSASASNNNDNSIQTSKSGNYSTVFLSFNGITRSTFDQSTGLITVIGNNESNLPLTIKSFEITSYTSDNGVVTYSYKRNPKENNINLIK